MCHHWINIERQKENLSNRFECNNMKTVEFHSGNKSGFARFSYNKLITICLYIWIIQRLDVKCVAHFWRSHNIFHNCSFKWRLFAQFVNETLRFSTLFRNVLIQTRIIRSNFDRFFIFETIYYTHLIRIANKTNAFEFVYSVDIIAWCSVCSKNLCVCIRWDTKPNLFTTKASIL